MMRDTKPIHEWLYLALGLGVSVALVAVHGWQPLTFATTVLTLAYAMLLWNVERGSRWWLLTAYVATWAFYAGSSLLVEALDVRQRHLELWVADVFLFGRSPVRAMEGVLPAWALDVLSVGYLSYHIYLHWALLDALLARGNEWRLRLGQRLFTAFALGFVGYLLWPAAPPAAAFPDIFTTPLEGGALTRWNAQINTAMAARYDAFPSLHALVTLTLLAWDWRAFRTRFWIMLIPSLLMLVATLALRLHYAVDLLAAVLLFVSLHVFFHFHDRKHNPPLP
ncbi:MAG: phosphatase PAP2 family protein [Prosthecobacter sp.]